MKVISVIRNLCLANILINAAFITLLTVDISEVAIVRKVVLEC